ncbi:MAG: aldo/keto reductase [Alphaproteobacteria bacterium]|nr:aldo/keto reductase [Alphaproteobacteria bacterium]
MIFEASRRVNVAKTGLSIPSICFGGSALGDMPTTYGYSVDDTRARATIDAIFDSPFGFIDTSRNYGMGRSEERIGAAIKARGGQPKGFVISSKLDRNMDSMVFDGSQARRSLEGSLKALGVDHIPLLHLHDPEYAADLSQVTGPRGAIAELMRMKEEGLVTAIGLAAGKVDIMLPLLRDFDFDALISHNRYTLLNRNARAMFEFAHGRGMAVMNAAPYASGILSKGAAAMPLYAYQPADAEIVARVKKIEALCAEHGVPLGAAALQFSMRDPLVASTVVGVTSPERVKQTLEWAALPIPEALWAALLALPFDAGDPEAKRVYNPG